MKLRDNPAGPPAGSVKGKSGGIGRSASAYAERVSNDLRRHEGEYLGDRRTAAALSLVAMGSLGVVAAYQFGLIKKMPEPSLDFLDATAVDASGEAYEMFKTPDAALGLFSQAITLLLVGAGAADRSSERPWLPILAGAKAISDAVSAGYLTVEQQSKHGRFCSWCLTAAVANAGIVKYVLPEALTALRGLRNR